MYTADVPTDQEISDEEYIKAIAEKVAINIFENSLNKCPMPDGGIQYTLSNPEYVIKACYDFASKLVNYKVKNENSES
jgi:hypothetical protein